jgi:hypothetical protein
MAKTEAAPQARRSDRGASSLIPVLVALLAVGGFLAWLATRQPTTESVAVTEPGNTAVDQQGTPTGTVTEPAALNQQGGRALVGQDIELQSVPVSSMMGPHFLWVELPGGSPYLLRLDQSVVNGATPVPTSGNVRVIGRVEMKDEAVISGWVQEGLLQDEAHRMQAEFGTTYIMARLVQPAAT